MKEEGNERSKNGKKRKHRERISAKMVRESAIAKERFTVSVLLGHGGLRGFALA